jgi:hypothetical protein
MRKTIKLRHVFGIFSASEVMMARKYVAKIELSGQGAGNF